MFYFFPGFVFLPYICHTQKQGFDIKYSGGGQSQGQHYRIELFCRSSTTMMLYPLGELAIDFSFLPSRAAAESYSWVFLQVVWVPFNNNFYSAPPLLTTEQCSFFLLLGINHFGLLSPGSNVQGKQWQDRSAVALQTFLPCLTLHLWGAKFLQSCKQQVHYC